VHWLRAMLLATPPVGDAGCCEAIAELDLRADPSVVGAPTLVIAAEQDPATPPEHSRLIASNVPHARQQLISPPAHLANVERATEVSQLIVEHLEG
jgi:3-oxoadipate enol-lactonase